MKRHFGIPAAGQKAVRGDQPSGPRSEPIHGSNVIFLADHPCSPPGRRHSERLTAAPFFTQAPIDEFEFGSCFFTVVFLAAPTVFVGAAIGIYALLVA